MRAVVKFSKNYGEFTKGDEKEFRITQAYKLEAAGVAKIVRKIERRVFSVEEGGEFQAKIEALEQENKELKKALKKVPADKTDKKVQDKGNK